MNDPEYPWPRTVTVAITGASGVQYGLRLIECLIQSGLRVYLLVSQAGQVVLRMPVRKGVSVLVDQLGPGAMFGSCVCMDLATYTLSAQCTEETRLLKIDALLLKKLMDDDLRMGYAIQTQISKIYFQRYLDAMHKLQAIVMNLSLESEPHPA